jgi:hypothetical protein
LLGAGLGAASLHCWHSTAQAFVENLDPSMRWDLLQATFALQALPRAERMEVLRRLRPRVQRLALVEFDIPRLAHGSDAYIDSLLHRYHRIAAGYNDDRALVAHGFLAPMLLGQLRPPLQPSNWEQPQPDWQEDLAACGYHTVHSATLFDYAWSPAFLLVAI